MYDSYANKAWQNPTCRADMDVQAQTCTRPNTKDYFSCSVFEPHSYDVYGSVLDWGFVLGFGNDNVVWFDGREYNIR